MAVERVCRRRVVQVCDTLHHHLCAGRLARAILQAPRGQLLGKETGCGVAMWLAAGLAKVNDADAAGGVNEEVVCLDVVVADAQCCKPAARGQRLQLQCQDGVVGARPALLVML